MRLELLKKNSSWGPTAIRVVAGIIFLLAGWSKLSDGVQMFSGMLEGVGFPLAGVLAWIVAVVELLGGAALILGIYTRVAAISLAIIMVVSTIVVWSGAIGAGGFQAARLDVLLLAAMISLALTGPGRAALKEL